MNVKEFYVNGNFVKFQHCHADVVGNDLVMFIMGDPVNEDGTLVKVGDRTPFMGYRLHFSAMILDLNLDILKKEHIAKIVFQDGKEFEGSCEFFPRSIGSNTHLGTIYHDMVIQVDAQL